MIAELVNTLVRRAAMALVPVAAALEAARFERRIDGFDDAQARLRREYGLTDDTPIRGYDDETRARIEALARARSDVRLAYTSGSTSTPKALAYPPERLRSFKRDSLSAGIRAWARAGIREPSIFVLSSLAEDESFASLAVFQRREPSRVQGLIEPARYLFMPALAPHLARFGATAVRLWLMVLSNPGLVYSTNPSTLAVLLAELFDDWPRATSMIRAVVAGEVDDPGTRRITRRVIATGAAERLARVASSSSPLPIADYLPGLSAYCCWDGGYVTSFLAQIHRWLPRDRYFHVPMYAMSTETIETLPYFGADGTIAFLPLGPRVVYELLPEDTPDDPRLLLAPRAAERGRTYALVVSDPWGLVRYQTEDLFLCAGHVRGLPDLRFVRRRGLTWSFTGEKLTGEQLTEAFARTTDAVPALRALGAQLTVMPTWPDGAALPGYHLLVGHPGRRLEHALDASQLATAFDAALSAINAEYAAKRVSARLAAPRVCVLPYDVIAEALDAKRTGAPMGASRAWESQFKLTPLIKRRYEEVFSDGAAAEPSAASEGLPATATDPAR
ncbi:GH3 auxin-responsive promoter family protein [Myxococcota bacterium]|nr:GH3 auxin-responsive promoter family protein [Myxococcota bacterium]